MRRPAASIAAPWPEISLLVVDMRFGFRSHLCDSGRGWTTGGSKTCVPMRAHPSTVAAGLRNAAQEGVYAEIHPERVLPVALSGGSAASVWLTPLCAPSNSTRHAEVTSRGRPRILRCPGSRCAHDQPGPHPRKRHCRRSRRLRSSRYPSVEHVGVSVLDGNGNPETKASTSELVIELDTLQYSLNEGPCVDSLVNGSTIVAAPNIRNAKRWPRYAPAAVELGLEGTARREALPRRSRDGRRPEHVLHRRRGTSTPRRRGSLTSSPPTQRWPSGGPERWTACNRHCAPARSSGRRWGC